MRVALLRVGIDSNPKTGGIHGPLFEDDTFEFIPIMDDDYEADERTYGNTNGQRNPNMKLVDYFPQKLQETMRHKSMHVDPEFRTFTYGDNTRPKRSLRNLKRDDMLVFYCGLKSWPHGADYALYLIGYFEVEVAGLPTELEANGHNISELLAENFHVMHQTVYERERRQLVLVKGYPPGSNGHASRLLTRAVRISGDGRNCKGNLSNEMQNIFGDFGGKTCFWRGLHWVDKGHVEKAAEYMRGRE
jgi:hypothetical protein